MEYRDLLKKYNNLIDLVERLRKENSFLRSQLDLTKSEQSRYNASRIETDNKIPDDKSSDRNEFLGVYGTSDSLSKINLFMSLFKGRSDVCAKRWENKNKGTSGYAPVCLNQWQAGVCKKPKISCSKCKNKDYAALDENTIENHLRGNIVIGVYPMLQDETCHFLAVDFDEADWQSDISVFRDVCIEFTIPVAVERSRSGKGGHVWFFFETPVSAALARKFGTILLTAAMNKRHEIQFKSYDRLFPSQDTMPKGGLGNLIALPLQKTAREKSNSEFIDEHFQSYEDQWAFLSTMQRIPQNRLEEIISELGDGHELGALKQDEEEGAEKPWEISKPKIELQREDFPKCIEIIKANMLFIPKAGVSQMAMNRLKRLASFKNPMFYRHQAMRLPTYGHPRIISCADETKEYLSLPRGCEPELVFVLKECVTNYGMIIADECHHASAFTYEQILKTTNAKYIYGLTATPTRKDGHHPILFMHCGPIRYRDNPKKQAENRPFDHYIVPRFTSLRVPLDIDEQEVSIQQLYTEIMENDFRNQQIIDDVLSNYHQGRNCIVLTLRTAHVESLANRLKDKVPDVFALMGGMGKKATREIFQNIADIPTDRNIILVATGHFIGEGFDEPRLDTLFLAMPISWKGTLQQYAGRLHRLYEAKKEVKIYDYVDIQVKMLEKMYQRRLNGYASMGYKAKGEELNDTPLDIIFDKDSFLPVFNQDICAATKEILIVSPFVRKIRTLQMTKHVKVALEKKIRVLIFTRPKEDFKPKDHATIQRTLDLLTDCGASVVFKSNIHQKFAVMDQKIVWYGSINLLSYGSAQESIIRIESSNIANELVKSIEKKGSQV